MLYVRWEPTQAEAAEFIKDIIQDKVVYDLGAGNGSFALGMSQYAKKVVAVELDSVLASDCRWRGLETIESSFMKVDLEEAEVIYMFLNLMGNYALTQKLKEDNWHGIIISHFYPLLDGITDIIKPNSIRHVKLLSGDRLPFLIYNL